MLNVCKTKMKEKNANGKKRLNYKKSLRFDEDEQNTSCFHSAIIFQNVLKATIYFKPQVNLLCNCNITKTYCII